MNFVTNKAIMVGVGVFATLMITTAVFVLLGYVLDIYGNISKIDYATIMSMDEFSKYNVTNYDGNRFTSDGTLTGIEIYNMINKYKSNDNVYINNRSGLNSKKQLLEELNNDISLSGKYYCTVIENTDGSIGIIYTMLLKSESGPIEGRPIIRN